MNHSLCKTINTLKVTGENMIPALYQGACKPVKFHSNLNTCVKKSVLKLFKYYLSVLKYRHDTNVFPLIHGHVTCWIFFFASVGFRSF